MIACALNAWKRGNTADRGTLQKMSWIDLPGWQ
jgi:hypothetical protein